MMSEEVILELVNGSVSGYGTDLDGTPAMYGEASEPSEDTFYRPDVDRLQQVLETLVRGLHVYFTPIVGFSGILCNMFGIFLVTRQPLCLESTCHYILAILISNSVYMVTVLHHWLNEFEIYFYQVGGWCQFVTFAMQTSDFTSTWNMVALCVDRFVAIRFPSLESKLCTVWRARLVIIALQITAVIVYLNISILYGVLQLGPRQYCTVLPMFAQTFQLLNHGHSVVNCLLPSLVALSLTMVMLEHKVHLSYLLCWPRKRTGPRSSNPIFLSTREMEMDEDRPCLALICSFILLQTPLFLAHIYFTVRTLSSSTFHMTLKDFLWQQVFLHVKYTSIALNLFIMVCTRGGFRRRCGALRLCRLLVIANRSRGHSSCDLHTDDEPRATASPMHFVDETRQAMELLNP